ncbi:hypothetical protein ACOMHN_031853 [Nucella lapillus]
MAVAVAAVTSVAIVVALSVIAIKLVAAMRDYHKLCYAMRQFPHNKGNFILGNLFEYPGPDERGLKFQRDMTAAFPRVLSVWMGPFFPMLIVNHPETIRTILRTSEPKAHRIYHLIEPWIGDGLLLSKGEKWGRNRRLLTPAFHFDILKPYLAIKNKAADVLMLAGKHLRQASGVRKKLDVKNLKAPQVQQALKDAFANSLPPVSQADDDIKAASSSFRDAQSTTLPSPFLVIPGKKHQDWFDGSSKEILDLLAEKRVAHVAWLNDRSCAAKHKRFERLNSKAQPKIRQMKDACDKDKFQGYHERGEYFEVFSDISMFTLDVILKCAFSCDTDCQRLGDQHPYVKAVFALSEMAVKRFFQPWYHTDWVYFLSPTGRRFLQCCREVHAVSDDVIQKRKQALASGSPSTVTAEDQSRQQRRRCLDFLDILLTARDDDNQGLQPEEIRAEVDTFLFEGHDTTASAISWVMYSLAEHHDIQAHCQAEVDRLLAGREVDDILWEDCSQLPYLAMCIKEAMRLHTPVPFMQRQLTQDTAIDGVVAPAGMVVNIVIYNIHHNPVVWEDSMEYRPERFTEENCNARNRYAFIPFSAGPRNCIGQTFAMHEIKLVMAKMLHRYTLQLDPSHKVEKFESLVMKTKTGIRMCAVPRQTCAQK